MDETFNTFQCLLIDLRLRLIRNLKIANLELSFKFSKTRNDCLFKCSISNSLIQVDKYALAHGLELELIKTVSQFSIHHPRISCPVFFPLDFGFVVSNRPTKFSGLSTDILELIFLDESDFQTKVEHHKLSHLIYSKVDFRTILSDQNSIFLIQDPVLSKKILIKINKLTRKKSIFQTNKAEFSNYFRVNEKWVFLLFTVTPKMKMSLVNLNSWKYGFSIPLPTRELFSAGRKPLNFNAQISRSSVYIGLDSRILKYSIASGALALHSSVLFEYPNLLFDRFFIEISNKNFLRVRKGISFEERLDANKRLGSEFCWSKRGRLAGRCQFEYAINSNRPILLNSHGFDSRSKRLVLMVEKNGFNSSQPFRWKLHVKYQRSEIRSNIFTEQRSLNLPECCQGEFFVSTKYLLISIDIESKSAKFCSFKTDLDVAVSSVTANEIQLEYRSDRLSDSTAREFSRSKRIHCQLSTSEKKKISFNFAHQGILVPEAKWQSLLTETDYISQKLQSKALTLSRPLFGVPDRSDSPFSHQTRPARHVDFEFFLQRR